MKTLLVQLITVTSICLCCLHSAHSQLRGHGGPVRALAISRDGARALSGSFDTSAIRWSLRRNTALQILRFHDSAVNAVAFLPDGRIATGGADARIAIWQPGKTQPQIVLQGHTAPIVGLAVSPNGAVLASASWDRTARLWPLAGGPPRVLNGNRENVNAVAFMPDNSAVVTAGYDATLRIWPLPPGASPMVTTLPTPLNAAVIAPDREVVTAGADGNAYFLSERGKLRGSIHVSDTPIIALAISPNGRTVAAASVRGSVSVIGRAAREVKRTLVGPGLPVWSVAFFPDNRTLLTGGTDRTIRRWNADTGDPIGAVVLGGPNDPLAAYAGDRGAEVFRACVACHTLKPDEGNRAGPSLAQLFGRRIATFPGYNFSPALKKLHIVWTPETVSKLFELGPAIYTPGTKMPQQTIGSAQDREALVQFLERATR